MIHDLWIKPPNEDWFNYTAMDSAYKISITPGTNKKEYNSWAYFPRTYARSLGFHQEEFSERGYKMQWRPQSNDAWREREKKRLARTDRKDMYDLLPKEWDKLVPITDHFVHLSKDRDEDQSDLLAYVESPEKGAQDVQTKIKAGRYLKKFYPDLSQDEIRYYSEAVQALTTGLQITMDPEIAAKVYFNGPNSCMKKYEGYFRRLMAVGIEHPSWAYFAGDLALAYLGSIDAPSARCLVWPDRKYYGRIYGAVDRMKQVLQNAGYTCAYNVVHNVFPGARMRIKYLINDEYIAWPYVDGVSEYTARKDDRTIVYIGREADISVVDKSLLKRTVIESNEEGSSHYNDPFVRRCILSNKPIPDGEEFVTHIDGYTEDIAALMSEIERHGYVLAEDGWYCHVSNLIKTIENGEEHTRRIRNFRGRDWVEVIADEGETMRVFMRRGECFQRWDGRWERKGKIGNYICYRNEYFLSLEFLFQVHPNANPARYHSEFPMTKEEDTSIWRRWGQHIDYSVFKQIIEVIRRERAAKKVKPLPRTEINISTWPVNPFSYSGF